MTRQTMQKKYRHREGHYVCRKDIKDYMKKYKENKEKSHKYYYIKDCFIIRQTSNIPNSELEH